MVDDPGFLNRIGILNQGCQTKIQIMNSKLYWIIRFRYKEKNFKYFIQMMYNAQCNNFKLEVDKTTKP